MKNFYQLLAAAFVCVAVWSMPLDAMAAGEARAAVLHRGTSGDITWEIYDNGLLKLTGTGDYYRAYSASGVGCPPWCEYSSSISTAVVNISGITSTSHMFYNCSSLTSLDLSKLDTSQVTSMSNMFDNCSNLTSLDLSKFNTPKLESMECMFQNCNNLTSLNVSSFNTLHVVSMGYMFNGCNSLTSLDLSSFVLYSLNGRGLQYMFNACSSLNILKTPREIASGSLSIALPARFSDPGGRGTNQLTAGFANTTLTRVGYVPPASGGDTSGNTGGGNTPSNPGQQLPNTAAEDDTALHIIMFGIFAGLACFTYGLKRRYARR